MLMARRVARLLTPLAVFLVLVLAGGGWYFASQINHDGLRVDPYALDKDLRVTAVRPGSITLRGASATLRTTGTYGVAWTGGYGQVTGTPKGSREVTRSFHLLTGHLPDVDQAVGITEDAYPDDPQVALGVPVREVPVVSPAGTFPAWYVGGRGTTWVVLVHGKGANRTSMLRMMRVPVRMHLPSLDITYRNDAVLPLDASHRYQYGRTEWRDLDAAVGYARDHGAKHVVLVGASMGGSVVAEFLERSSLRWMVRGLVLDSPLLSFDHAVDLAASRKDLPLVGWQLPGVLTWTAKRIASWRYGVDWHALDHLDDTRWARVPTLLIHGTADRTVPESDSVALAKARHDVVYFQPHQGIGHLEVWNADPAQYEAELASFLQVLP